MLKLYNTLNRQKEIFEPIEDGKVGFYSCGPTVYWYQHIGNLRAYFFNDILKRVLIYNGYEVKHIMNITDVGHLTSDADEGEDKIEKAAIKEGKSAKEISEYYFKAFEKDLKKLNIIMPDVWCKATEHIQEQIDFIKKIEERGFTYKTSDGIYFDTSKLDDYGKLARLEKVELEAGKRVEMGEKRSKTDFALWKFSKKPGQRQQEWDSPWGIGFPGWHIECSAMSSKYLGEQFDIHTGGEDHIGVHHTNEIAQSETAFEKKPWVKYWLHGAFLIFKGEKVSKSKGGLFTLSELEEKGFNSLDFRYFLLTAHYRNHLEFSLENLINAKNSLQRMKNIILKSKDDEKINEKYLNDFENAINDDLDTPKALAILWDLLRDVKAQGKIKTIERIDRVFGLDLLKQEKIEIPDNIQKLLEEREQEKKSKNWDKADEIRKQIEKLGYRVEDTKQGQIIKKN